MAAWNVCRRSVPACLRAKDGATSGCAWIQGTEPWSFCAGSRNRTTARTGGTAGSAARTTSDITCPTMIVAGWADGYTNIALRAFERMSWPRRVIIGPWARCPRRRRSRPHIDLVPELIRWFARWLRDEPNGIDEEAPIAVFVRRSTRPAPDLTEMRGTGARADMARDAPRSRVLLPAGAGRDEISVRGDTGHGLDLLCRQAAGGLPEDQQADDARSLTYDWEPLGEELEILGHPRLRLAVTSPHPVAFLSARLCDVFPDGTSALVSRGILNLTHQGATTTRSPRAWRGDPIELELEATSWVFEQGHRVRLALAGSDWPNMWPPPHGGAPCRAFFRRARLPVLDGPAVAPPPAFRPAPPKKVEPEEPTRSSPPSSDGSCATASAGRPGCDELRLGLRLLVRREDQRAVRRARRSRQERSGVPGPVRGLDTASTGPRHRFRPRHTLRPVGRKLVHVVIQVIAVEDGEDGIGHVERRFERTIPRRLQ